MDIQKFAELLDAYGGNTARWPENQRGDAQSFADDNPELTAPLVEAASALDHMLDGARGIPASDLLARRILAQSPNPFLSDWRQAAAAAAAVLVVGAMGGYAGGSLLPQSATDSTDDYYADVFDSLSADWEFDLGGGA